MNPAHLHLLLNHIPVIGVLVGVVLLAAAAATRSGPLVRAGLALFGLLGVAAVVVYLSGERAEEVIEALAGVDEALIEGHEEAALPATIATGAFGALCLLGLWLYRRPRQISRRVAIVALMASLLPAALLAWTALLGGRIRHQEARPGWTAPAVEAATR